MAGVKGRSGRRARSVEQKHLDVIDKAWELTMQMLDSSSSERFKTAKDIVLKDVVTKIEGKGFDSKSGTILIFRPAGSKVDVKRDIVSQDADSSTG